MRRHGALSSAAQNMPSLEAMYQKIVLDGSSSRSAPIHSIREKLMERGTKKKKEGCEWNSRTKKKNTIATEAVAKSYERKLKRRSVEIELLILE